jgi:hypothetical protein
MIKFYICVSIVVILGSHVCEGRLNVDDVLHDPRLYKALAVLVAIERKREKGRGKK